MRKCAVCYLVKDFKEFNKASIKRWRYENKDWDIDRNRRWKEKNGYVWKRYKITKEQYMNLLLDNTCRICKKEPGLTKRGFKVGLHIDHNHVTEEVRGLLCHHCNFGLGHFFADDGIELLERAIKYIKKEL